MPEVPLSLVAPVRISNDTGPGLFLPHSANEPAMLTWLWGDKAHLLRLGGPGAFEYGSIGPGYIARGTLITEIEVRVDLSSRYDALNKSDPLGALILTGSEISVVAKKAGDPFADEHEAPLWGGFKEGTSEEKVGFSRWSIIARDEDEALTLWSSAEVAAVTN